MDKENKLKTIESILKYLHWQGTQMVFPIYNEHRNATIKLDDLINIIDFHEDVQQN